MNELWIIVALCALTLYGLVKLIHELMQYGARHNFGIQFLEKLRIYYDSAGKDTETYAWLIHRSNKMQGEMGNQGIIHGYKPPYQSYIISNYPIILNMLPELRHMLELERTLLSQNPSNDYIHALNESLVRYLGSLEDAQEEVRHQLKNPLKWFREGVRDLIALPAYLFAWLGVISDTTARRWTSSIFFSTISGVVALVGFVSAIITIVIGWDEFIGVVSQVLP